VSLVSGCFGGDHHSAGHLSVAVSLPQAAPRLCNLGNHHCSTPAPPSSLRRYTLTCSPDGGSMPSPGRACRAIGDYLTRRNHLGECLGYFPDTWGDATVTGSYHGRPFHLKLEAGYSWCGQNGALLRDFWTLSTFPCTVLVLRSGPSPYDAKPGTAPIPAYEHWARASGCTSA
jgi:hypothetical protein